MQRGPEYTEKDGELGSLLQLVFQVVLDPATLEASVVGEQVAVLCNSTDRFLGKQITPFLKHL